MAKRNEDSDDEIKRSILLSVVDCAHYYEKIPSTRDYEAYPGRYLTLNNTLEYFESWYELLQESDLPEVPPTTPEIVRELKYENHIEEKHGTGIDSDD